MFEGKLPRPGPASGAAAPFDRTASDDGALHPMAWDELLSRLAAARELRVELAEPDNGEASFHARSARRIAGLRDGEHSINPDDLGNRKGNCRNDGIAAEDKKPAPRGIR